MKKDFRFSMGFMFTSANSENRNRKMRSFLTLSRGFVSTIRHYGIDHKEKYFNVIVIRMIMIVAPF